MLVNGLRREETLHAAEGAIAFPPYRTEKAKNLAYSLSF